MQKITINVPYMLENEILHCIDSINLYRIVIVNNKKEGKYMSEKTKKGSDKKIVVSVLAVFVALIIVGLVFVGITVGKTPKTLGNTDLKNVETSIKLSDYCEEDLVAVVSSELVAVYPDSSADEIGDIASELLADTNEKASVVENYIEVSTEPTNDNGIVFKARVLSTAQKFMQVITGANDSVNSFAWGWFGLILLLGTGLICTLITKVFQVFHLRHWWGKTIGSVFKKESHKKNEEGAVSQFQALCTALAATIGTGNIAGVAAAIVVGGPGAVFWMWMAAILGMMTNFSENILGIYYRRRNSENEWSGGAMYYLQDGLGSYKGFKTVGKVLAVIFSFFAILASFGIGNMGQINKITLNIENAFFSDVNAPTFLGASVVNWAIGIVLMIIGGFIILGGLKRIASFAEKVVPFMALAYIFGAIIIIAFNYSRVGAVFVAIFKFAWGVKAVGGAVVGIAIKEVIKAGCKRGVFSNEAGLGSSVMVHSNSTVKEPVKQGLWGIFEVFADTIVVCTMTAVVILSSDGFIDLNTGLAIKGVEDQGATLVADAFGARFGAIGTAFIAVAVLLFAFTTVMGWSHYGSKSVEYVAGVKGAKIYRIIFVLMIISGAVMQSSLAWDVSDTFNGLMMIPNLIGVLALTPMVVKITKNYVDRKIKGKKDVKPMLSYDPVIEAEHAKYIEETGED